MKAVTQEPPQSHAQQFEQAIATAFTCRSIIKYGSVLSEEQKNEIIADIDTALRFLRDRLVANASIEAKTILPELQKAGILTADALKAMDDDDDEEHDKPALRELYRIYHAYLNMQQGNGTGVIVKRFDEAMATISEVQRIVEKSSDIYPSNIENLLHRVRGFIADISCLFLEFAHAITNALQGNDIYIDTEELSSMHRLEDDDKHKAYNLEPLISVYETHQGLNKKKGTVSSRVAEATAFLMFLEENFGVDIAKRDEILSQLHTVTKLLNDLSLLLSDYESSTFLLLQQE